MTTAANSRIGRFIAIACVLALVVTAAMWWVFAGMNGRRVTAHFAAAVGVYPGGDVRVLGVKVGTIDEVVPEGKTVRVVFTVDRSVRVPENAQAVVVAPSVVSDRYVQLAPAYTGGPTMGDDAVIPRERTATPVELDDLYQSLDKLTTALGPNGANADGALADLLNAAAKNLEGNGQALNDTLKNLGQATRTLSGSKEDLFATVDNLQKFTAMLAANDSQVRDFNKQLADVSKMLADERGDLGAALNELATALQQVQGFIKDNREVLKSNVDKLASITQVLVNQRAALAETLDVAPLALGNLQNSYNAASGTLDTRANINELNQPPIVLICKLVQQATPNNVPQVLAQTCKQLEPILTGAVPLPTPAQAISDLNAGKLPLPLPAAGVPR
ncbi:MCE family protein [Lentzea flava]|uniref:ABC transporter substrate-binding protein n=1 Tax=Lentzea flava TaxID=103732 RepID=A0ABQ2UHJ4_9PSEU|nr:MCE family protein [Lentzea flava]MCP2198866.1 virulence factor Mce family protein [Lentzea flava]GGU30663.1 ABC transporter substrate-binding protein [Lentzea flava]